jgi:hypothetical protein
VNAENDLETAQDGAQLVTGEKVAWTTKQGTKTTGLSSVHRIYDGRVTYCNHAIPGEDRRAGLDGLLSALNVCKRCERMYGQARDAEGRY